MECPDNYNFISFEEWFNDFKEQYSEYLCFEILDDWVLDQLRELWEDDMIHTLCGDFQEAIWSQ